MNPNDKKRKEQLVRYSNISHAFKIAMGIVIALCIFALFGSMGTIDYSTSVPISDEEMAAVWRNIILSIVIGTGATLLYRKSAAINDVVNEKLAQIYEHANLRRELRLLKIQSDHEEIENLLRDIENGNK